MEGAREATIDEELKSRIYPNAAVQSTPRILVVTDCRRPSDVDYFKCHQEVNCRPILLLRVDSSLAAREQRGFQFKVGIDDADTECALDRFQLWHDQIANNGDNECLQRVLSNIANKSIELATSCDTHIPPTHSETMK